MNCGIEVLKRLNEIIETNLNEVIAVCETKVDHRGLSLYDLKQELEQVMPCQAVMSLKLIKETPYIAFIGFDAKGHYVLVEQIDQKVHLYDPSHTLTVCSKLWFYLIWSKKALIFT